MVTWPCSRQLIATIIFLKVATIGGVVPRIFIKAASGLKSPALRVENWDGEFKFRSYRPQLASWKTFFFYIFSLGNEWAVSPREITIQFCIWKIKREFYNLNAHVRMAGAVPGGWIFWVVNLQNKQPRKYMLWEGEWKFESYYCSIRWSFIYIAVQSSTRTGHTNSAYNFFIQNLMILKAFELFPELHERINLRGRSHMIF